MEISGSILKILKGILNLRMLQKEVFFLLQNLQQPPQMFFIAANHHGSSLTRIVISVLQIRKEVLGGVTLVHTQGKYTWLQLHPGYPPDMNRATSPSSC